jgi:hypothetical protein
MQTSYECWFRGFGTDTYDQDSTQGSRTLKRENGSEYNMVLRSYAWIEVTTMKDAQVILFFLGIHY